MMRSRRLHAQKKALFWLGSSWRKKILPKPVNDAIWKRANDVLSCEEHERQISSDTSPFEQNIKVPQRMMPTAPMQLRQSHQRGYALPAQQNRQEGARLEERNIMGELNMYRQLGLKPNFCEIDRRYGLDRHTVARYWNGGGGCPGATPSRTIAAGTTSPSTAAGGPSPIRDTRPLPAGSCSSTGRRTCA